MGLFGLSCNRAELARRNRGLARGDNLRAEAGDGPGCGLILRPRGVAVQSGVFAFRQHRRTILADRAATSPAL